MAKISKITAYSTGGTQNTYDINAVSVNGHTVGKDVPANALFTDTVTTATTTGTGNAVTAITANNGALTVTKGSTFLTSVPIASSSVLGGVKVGTNLSINASTGVLSSTDEKVTQTILGSTATGNYNVLLGNEDGSNGKAFAKQGSLLYSAGSNALVAPGYITGGNIQATGSIKSTSGNFQGNGSGLTNVNAATVNNHTVDANVPSDAEFTDMLVNQRSVDSTSTNKYPILLRNVNKAEVSNTDKTQYYTELTYCPYANTIEFDGTIIANRFDGNYRLATASTCGIVKVGSGLSITSDGTLSATGGSSTDTKVTQTATNSGNANYPLLFKNTTGTTNVTDTSRFASDLHYNPSTKNLQVTKINGVTVGNQPKFTDTTYSVATSSSNGLMSSGDKELLNTLPNMVNQCPYDVSMSSFDGHTGIFDVTQVPESQRSFFDGVQSGNLRTLQQFIYSNNNIQVEHVLLIRSTIDTPINSILGNIYCENADVGGVPKYIQHTYDDQRQEQWVGADDIIELTFVPFAEYVIIKAVVLKYVE